MTNLLDALEVSLQLLEEGASMESVLARYPKESAQLGPLLQAALVARSARLPAAPPDAMRRGRARLLQAAAQMRESRSSRRRMIPAWPRLAITLGLVAMLALTSTRLVSASNGALPGDQLYGVKRSWEDLQLFLVIHEQDHYQLESQFEQERLNEIDDLLRKRRTAPIEFSGLLMHQQDGSWVVSGIPVAITAATQLPASALVEGVPVAVGGVTRSDGVVQASSVQLLLPGVPLPPLEPSEMDELVPSGGPQNPGTPPILATPQPGLQPTPIAAAQETYQFTGIVESMQVGVWRINGQVVHVDQAQIVGMVRLGSVVQFQGYFSSDNKFVATRIQVVLNPVHDSGKGKGDSGGGSGGGSGGAEPPDGPEGGGTGE